MALLTNLEGYWKLDEASGNALDAHGSNDLTDTNTVGTATGKINDARDFERANTEYFALADNPSLSLGADTAFTIQAWVKIESSNTQNIFSKGVVGGAGSAHEYILFLNNTSNRPSLIVGDGSTNQTITWGTDLNTATWYHIIAYHDPSANTLGMIVNDGTPVTAAWSNGTQDTAGPFRLGANTSNANSFDGLIDEVAFWKRKLTAAEITQLYNSGAGLAYPFAVTPDPVDAAWSVAAPTVVIFDRRIKLHVRPRKTLLTVPDRKAKAQITDIEVVESPICMIEGEEIQFAFQFLGANSVGSVDATVYKDGQALADGTVFLSGDSFSNDGNVALCRKLTAVEGHGGAFYALVIQADVDGNTQKARVLIYIVDPDNLYLPDFADVEVVESPLTQIEGEAHKYSFFFQGQREVTSPGIKAYKPNKEITNDVFVSGDSNDSGDNVLSPKRLTAAAGDGGQVYVVVPSGNVDGNTQKAIAQVRIVAPEQDT